MNRDDIIQIFDNKTFDISSTHVVRVDKSMIVDAAVFMKQQGYNMMLCLSCVDLGNCFELVYNFYSTDEKKGLIIKTSIDRENPKIESVSSVYPSVGWYEREIFDLFGVIFSDHGDLRRILMPEGWEGYPLRKDYVQKDSRLRWNNRR